MDRAAREAMEEVISLSGIDATGDDTLGVTARTVTGEATGNWRVAEVAEAEYEDCSEADTFPAGVEHE